ncbi:uncharacterized protein LOC113370260 [Ctenocephalides felis]|uniref:uncharacterized protein LOC113370260 n=1 Tax=Ctenocephalides felis TaxID=7515 RepID=UPI000E6E39DB|nr:uncharacterized protein LOC113370260 [Ctenocephalides felis]
MALVMLPCDLPWWPQLQRLLISLQSSSSTKDLVDGMRKIHDMCNISLDPEEDDRDAAALFEGLTLFLDTCLSEEEKQIFMDRTLKCMVQRALDLKKWRPPRGLHFSLQQQADCNELSQNLLSSLLAHAFFSTYPKRTNKTHPTLQDFNFTHFFTHLDSNIQQAKLKSILHYFDWIENNNNTQGSVKISRQVMSSRHWLTIEDWLECSLPLCPLKIKHEGRLSRADPDTLHVCFSNSLVGGKVLTHGNSQECLQFCSMPELLCMMLSCEALEDNETIFIENARKTTRLDQHKSRPSFEFLEEPQEISVCCMDPEDYSKLPASQFEEDNVLRELNKCLLAFRQKPSVVNESLESKSSEPEHCSHRRLSPIGESICNTPPDVEATVIIKKPTSKSPTPPEIVTNPIDRKRWLSPCDNTVNSRRERFIVLGSSGECLPVNRRASPFPDLIRQNLPISEDTSSDEEFHSARTSLDGGSGDETQARRYSLELDTPARRSTFAARLREALRHESDFSSSTADDFDEDASGYAVGISVAGSGLADGDIRLRRGGSGGFMLTAERGGASGDSDIHFNESFDMKRAPPLHRHDTSESSRYSFSTEYSSELEEVYEQFSRWLEDPIFESKSKKPRELDARDLAVVRFAGSLLKRTLSESFAGVPLTEGCVNSTGIAAENSSIVEYNRRKNQIAVTARSLSLELARHKHRLAAQLTEIDENENLTDSNEDKQSVLSYSTGSLPSDASIETIIHNCAQITNSSDTNVPNKRKLKWAVTVIEAMEQTLASENVVLSLPKSKISEIAHKRHNKGGLKSISTGNWGCGKSHAGDPQLKLIIQWLAASVAGVPTLIYYTNGHESLAKLDTLCRVLVDRKWTVGELVSETLGYSQALLLKHQTNSEVHLKTLFETLISGI